MYVYIIAFGGKNFNLIGCRKMEAVAGALKLGYDVIFSDVDIAVLRDPIDYLFFPHVDYTHSTNNGCNKKWKFSDVMEGNTGYMSPHSLFIFSSLSPHFLIIVSSISPHILFIVSSFSHHISSSFSLYCLLISYRYLYKRI